MSLTPTGGADLTILEEGTEFLERFRAVLSGGVATLPMMTSCSPGWIQFIEHNYPEHFGEPLHLQVSSPDVWGSGEKLLRQEAGQKTGGYVCGSIMPLHGQEDGVCPS